MNLDKKVNIKKTNPFKEYKDFMGYRVQTNSNNLDELDKKLKVLIDDIEIVDLKLERETYDLETLESMRLRMREQKLHDQLEYKLVAPKL